EKIEDYLNIKHLEIICKYFYSDNTIIKAYSDTEKFASEIESKTSDSSASLINYLNYCKTIYDLAGDLFLQKDPRSLSTYLNFKALKTLLNINKIDPFRTINEAN